MVARSPSDLLIASPPSTNSLLLGLWAHFSTRRRIQLGLLLIVMLASGGAELLSLGAVVPFLSVLSDPEKLWQEPIVQALSNRIGLIHSSDLLLAAMLMFVFAAVLAALVRLTNLWLSGRLAAAIGSDLSCEAYRRTLYQPYEVHVQRNSAAVITGTTSQIGLTVVALNSVLQLITSVVVAVALLLGLLLINTSVALASAALFATAYALLAYTSRRELRSNSLKIAEASTQQLKALQEGLGAIRDVLLDRSQTTYLQTYRQADRPQRQLSAKNAFLSAFPRYALEALGMVAIALLGGLLVFQRGRDFAVIPLLGTLALGAQRLLPALQQIYGGWAALKSYNAAIQSVLTMLNQSLPPQVNVESALPLHQSVRLEAVHFRYKDELPEVLQGLNLEIRRGERIGLIGSTGSGKSTAIDLLMGLLTPTSGRILVDGVDLHDPKYPERLVAWRAAISHVPQHIYLADSSIAENIAFGIPRHKIDFVRVQHAASQAQLAGFIDASPDGYESFVGERGIRLSGGQRQRIGIARALYKQSRVLILDEATSALDNETELAVMESIENLRKNLTTVMIAHRLSTLRNCDRVIQLVRGAVSANDSPHQLF